MRDALSGKPSVTPPPSCDCVLRPARSNHQVRLLPISRKNRSQARRVSRRKRGLSSLGGAKVAMALTRFCTWPSRSVLPSLVLDCSSWCWTTQYQPVRVTLSAVPVILTSRSLGGGRYVLCKLATTHYFSPISCRISRYSSEKSSKTWPSLEPIFA